MQVMGFDRFAIIGHDRGSYIAYRAALDHPKAFVLDSVPILKPRERCNAHSAREGFHRFCSLRAILADPDAWYGRRPDSMGDDQENFRHAIHAL